MKDTVLITGAGGFIGSHVAERFVRGGYNVRVFLHYGARGTLGWLDDSPVKDALEVVTGDIRDYDAVHRAAQGADGIVHLAALIAIPYSYRSPLAYIRTNIEGTYNVLQAARESGAANVLVTSSSETYGPPQYLPVDERHPMLGSSPYAATKVAADHLALSYWRSFETPVKVVRPFNTFGPRQSVRAVIPTIISQMISGSTNIKLGNSSSTRDFTFVTDTADAFYSIYECEQVFGEAINVGTGTEISAGDLAHEIARLCGREVTITSKPRTDHRPGTEVARMVSDSSRLRYLCGWAPSFSLEDGLRETITWIEANRHLLQSANQG